MWRCYQTSISDCTSFLKKAIHENYVLDDLPSVRILFNIKKQIRVMVERSNLGGRGTHLWEPYHTILRQLKYVFEGVKIEIREPIYCAQSNLSTLFRDTLLNQCRIPTHFNPGIMSRVMFRISACCGRALTNVIRFCKVLNRCWSMAPAAFCLA